MTNYFPRVVEPSLPDRRLFPIFQKRFVLSHHAFFSTYFWGFFSTNLAFMIDTAQYRGFIGLFNYGSPARLQQKDKWERLMSGAKFFFFCIFLDIFSANFGKKIALSAFQVARRGHRSLLFITICFYYFKAVNFLCICGHPG